MMYRLFHDEGYRFFGIKGVTDGVCDCGNPKCAALLKHPWFSNWQHTPEWSDEQLELMEEMGQLDYGYGVVVNDGLLVIDVDARNGGMASYTKLIEKIPSLTGAGLIVETGSGNGSKHLYFKAPSGVALMQHHEDYPGIDLKSIGYVVGPGSKHISGKNYVAVVGTPSDIGEAPQSLIDLIKKPETYRASFDGKHIDLADKDIEDMLGFMSSDCDHNTWVKTGMAIHHATGGNGFDLWDTWSADSAKYPGSDTLERRWHSFGKTANPVTVGTLIHHAKAAGWSASVTFDAGDEFSEYVDESTDLDTKGIDLLKPPGFVGKVADWIESQSRRPRRHLSVAGALTAMGNVAGLRYTDDKDGVTSNLFTFCVAGSRTGKESIQQAVAQIHRAAGIATATHGAIKSEQEIVRNLIRHQAALYIIDEIGIFLQKVKNAQVKGGASYLDGVIGMLMGAYSKADGFMLLTGDAKEEMQQILLKEIAQLTKRLDNNEGDPVKLESRIEQIKSTLSSIENGLDRPFLSLIGFTTPITFDDLVDYHSATNGFIGRSLIFNERETAPRSKRNFSKNTMSDGMKATLAQIYNGGEFDTQGDGRVEYYGDRIKVVTDSEAKEMLENALDWFEDQAEAHKGVTGLESLYLGAYELVSKVSLILACPEGRRTTEHVRWSFALIKNDLDSKARLVTANDRQDDAPGMAMQARIANLIDGDGEKVSVIYNRLRKVKRDDIDAALDDMVKRGVALKVELTHSKNGKKYEVFRMNSQG